MRRELLLLEEMANAAERAHRLIDGLTVAGLLADELRCDALMWNFTVLGEASTHLPQEIKTRFSDVPWQRLARLRNRIVHGYWSIDLNILHTTAETQLSGSAAEIRRVLGRADRRGVDRLNAGWPARRRLRNRDLRHR